VKLPTLTHLQFLILDIVGGAEMSGRDLREKLRARGVRKTGPAFYQLMARLEDAGFVKGWYDQKIIDGQIIKERRYRILGAGAKARENTLDFYRQRELNSGRLEGEVSLG